MQLPENENIDISKLSSVFSDTTNSYKFYWFLAILDSLKENGNSTISMNDIALRMIANVWYPLDYFKLSFGKQDGFKPIAQFVSSKITIDNSTSSDTLFSQLHSKLSEKEIGEIFKRLKYLLNWVPYRFIRPFFANELRGLIDHQVNTKIIELANKNFAVYSSSVIYRFVGNNIELSNAWVEYLQKHQFILRGFISWHLVRFLQKHNSNVIGLSEKLVKPSQRDLKLAASFWKTYLKENPNLNCIYSKQIITFSNLSLDHFIPWSFVAHDQIWNIIPTPKNVNSSKNDWLPSFDLYFEAFCDIQQKAFRFHFDKGNNKLLEDYSLFFADSLENINQMPSTIFSNGFKRQILPQIQTAQNMGFPYPFIYQ
jgi:hypothetical protein